MPYVQAYECLKDSNSSIAQLLDALEDTVTEYIYLTTMAWHEARTGNQLREGVEEDLLKLLVLKKALKVEIETRKIQCLI
ncbi:hypothetical protein QUA41_30775 [Microcoleus sp. Pol11C1]|uniref:hypothetical protein n=1 Tax=unclassified Microcoleus TaxID=2642155 RepID=UPI002FD2CAA2